MSLIAERHVGRVGRADVLRVVMVLRAIVVLALGIGFLAADAGRPVLGNLLAVFWLAGAALTLRWVRQHPGHPRSKAAAVAAVVGVLAAVVGGAVMMVDALDLRRRHEGGPT